METTNIFSAQHLLTMEGPILSPGALAVRDGVLLETGDPRSLRQKYPEATEEDFSDAVMLPGLVNAHADLSLTLFSEHPHMPYQSSDGRLLLMPWLVAISRFKSGLGIADQQKAVQQGLELSKAGGVTTLGDQCRFPAAVPLYEKSGLRVVCLAEIENIQRKMAQDDFEQALALVDEIIHAKHPRVSAGLAPLSAYALSKNLLRILTNHALQLQVPMHLHAALSFSEMEFFYDSLGEISAVLFREAGWEDRIPPPHKMTPIQYLHEIGVLRAKPAVLGCLHLGPTDAAILQHSACSRIYAPQAFEHLQVGEVDWKKVYQDKAQWAIGSMSVAAGSDLDLWNEMRTIFYACEGEDRDALSRWILQAATLGGAKVLNLDARIGSLEKDKAADFIVVDPPAGDDSLMAGLIDQTRHGRLVASFVAGECVFRRA